MVAIVLAALVLGSQIYRAVALSEGQGAWALWAPVLGLSIALVIIATLAVVAVRASRRTTAPFFRGGPDRPWGPPENLMVLTPLDDVSRLEHLASLPTGTLSGQRLFAQPTRSGLDVWLASDQPRRAMTLEWADLASARVASRLNGDVPIRVLALTIDGAELAFDVGRVTRGGGILRRGGASLDAVVAGIGSRRIEL
ncbi:hypothetical protein NY547_09185 [Cnuibacter physcomitrellae]|uniref:hypothetical protein n=1 Tax=Cnuibacter physcomitrellae TaxID=1619308 RepID=UPI002175AA79|nr:hypothetical protein [Cnuibacter physcomitrellae]MCS5497408.1 hypothetical protein [Cnuibacter physcomitrellae]